MEEEQELRERLKTGQVVPITPPPTSPAIQHRLWPEVKLFQTLYSIFVLIWFGFVISDRKDGPNTSIDGQDGHRRMRIRLAVVRRRWRDEDVQERRRGGRYGGRSA